jgi:hypothetical protein
MATALGHAASRAHGERLFFGGMAIALLAFTFVAFAPTYYLYPLFDATTTRGARARDAITPLVHAHGVATAAWMALLVVQTALIAGHRPDLHRRAGSLAIAAIAGVVATSLVAALHAAGAGAAPRGWRPEQFLLIQFGSLGTFTVLASLGLWYRRRPDVHKRLMLLATIGMLLPATGRVTRMLELDVLPAGTRGGMMLQALWLLPLVLYDLHSRGRVHPATLWAGGAILLLMPLRYFLAKTEAWADVGRMLLA